MASQVGPQTLQVGAALSTDDTLVKFVSDHMVLKMVGEALLVRT
jgi:hypothetical protein